MLSTTGCFSVTGTAGGDSFSLMSGFFVQQDDYYGDGEGQLLIVMGSSSDMCSRVEGVRDALEDADDASELESAWVDNMESNFWEVWVAVHVDSVGDSYANTTFDGSYDGGTSESEESSWAVSHYRDYLDEDYWSGDDSWDQYYDRWYSQGGEVRIGSHDVDQRIVGQLEGDLMTPEGDEDGSVTITFNVERCDGAEREIY